MNRAQSKENNTCTETVIPNCLKNWPGTDPMKLAGTNTATIVRLMAMTAKPISSAASSAAWYGDLPMRICRTMFSISTIASSTRMPVLSVMASKLIMFREKPRTSMTQNAGKMDSGSVIVAITVALRSRRNRKTTSTARAAPSQSVSIAASYIPTV
jgi:hypothetical protein